MIRFKVTDYLHMRYPTAGDWQWVGHVLVVSCIPLSQKRRMFLLLLHEAIEAVLCMVTGVSQEEVDEFDIQNYFLESPGDDRRAPYFFQHKIALLCEWMMSKVLLVDWQEYERELVMLSCPPKPIDDSNPDALGPSLAPGWLGLPDISPTLFRQKERS